MSTATTGTEAETDERVQTATATQLRDTRQDTVSEHTQTDTDRQILRDTQADRHTEAETDERVQTAAATQLRDTCQIQSVNTQTQTDRHILRDTQTDC